MPEKVEAWAQAKLEESRVLRYNDNMVPATLKEPGLELDTDKTLAALE